MTEAEVEPPTRETFAILVPALNEGKNICLLLDDILGQELGDRYLLEKIIVVSDGSIDDTEERVLQAITRDPRISLHTNPKRMGKSYSINEGKRGVDSDILVLVDADVRLEGPHTIRNLLEGVDKGYGLVAGNPKAVYTTNSLTTLVCKCGDIAREHVVRSVKDGNNIFGACGVLMALSRSFYSDLDVQHATSGDQVLSDDQFLYISCMKRNMKFSLREDAIVYISRPSNFNEYVRDVLRYTTAVSNTKAHFNDYRVSSEFHIPLKVKVAAMIELFRKKPLGAVAWLGYHLIIVLAFALNRYGLKRGIAPTWDVSESTKAGIIK